MSKLSDMKDNYSDYISVPWNKSLAPAQRVIFCIYDARDERSLQMKYETFELATVNAGHAWKRFDLTPTFAQWLKSNPYAESYYDEPEELEGILPDYLDNLDERFRAFMDTVDEPENTVIAISGVGYLFGLLKVCDIVERFASRVKGRLVVFFPGSYEHNHNNYRLLDGYDGWNYLAVAITSERNR